MEEVGEKFFVERSLRSEARADVNPERLNFDNGLGDVVG
jgi:hypothetical protein